MILRFPASNIIATKFMINYSNYVWYAVTHKTKLTTTIRL